MANATNSIAGDVQLSGDLSGGSSALSPQLASSGVTPGSYTLASITVNSKGIVTSASNGSIPDATTSVKGVVQVGSNIDVSAGVISIPDATTSVKGVVQVGSNIDVSAGVISVPNATNSVKGVVQVGSNIDVSAGVISVPNATNSVKGVVTSADTGNIVIVDGAVDVGPNIPKLNASNTFAAAQRVTPVALTSGSSIVVDAALSNIFTLTLDTTGTLSNPTNLIAGQYRFIITQDGTGGRTLNYGSSFKFAAGGSTTLSTGAGARDVLTCVSDGTNLYCSLAKTFA